MKSKSPASQFAKTLFVAITVSTLVAMPSAHAVSLYWDADADAAGNSLSPVTSLGGAGTWNAANTNWWDGAAASDQVWSSTETAVFTGAAPFTGDTGRVQLSAITTAAAMQFDTTGYIIDMCSAKAGTTAYDLTVNGISGSAASVVNSSTNTTKNFTINIASGTQSWGGTVSGRLGFIKDGAGTLNLSGAITPGATYADFRVKSGGRLNLIGNTNSNDAPGYVTVEGNSILDLGDNQFSARNWILTGGNTITASGTGRLILGSQFSTSDLAGKLSGSLMLQITGASAVQGANKVTGSINDHTGGLLFNNSNVAGISDLTVTQNTGLGTGPVSLSNVSNTNNLGIHTARVYFRSTAPTIGSLASSSTGFTKGAKSIMLGNEGVALTGTWNNASNIITTASTSGLIVGQIITDTTANGLVGGSFITGITDATHFTISNNATATKGTATAFTSTGVATNLSLGGLNTDTTFAGIINAIGTGSGITKTGTGKFTLAGAASYTGATTIADGTLVVGSGAAQAGVNSVTTTLNNNLITYAVGQLPAGLGVGQSITGTNIAAGATIIGIDTTTRQVYLSAGATAAGSTTPSFGAWQSLPAATSVVLGTSTTNGTLDLNNSTQRITGLTVGSGASAANQKVGNGSAAGDATLETTGTSVFDGVISDTVGSGTNKTKLTVISGSLTLSGANTYTGTTTVSSGTLLINGSLDAASIVTVESTGTLGGIGTVSGTVTIDGTLAPGASAGTLNTGTVILNSGATLSYELDGDDTTVGGGINDLAAVTGDLTLDGTLNVTGPNFASAAPGDTYRLLTYTGTLTNNTMNLGTMPTLPGGYTFSINTATTGQVNLVVSSSGNTAPGISNIADQSAPSGGNTGALPFTITDEDPNTVTPSGTSSNPTLVPNGNITFGGSGASRTVTVTPVSGLSGTATITVTLTDNGSLTGQDTFVLTVTDNYLSWATANGVTGGENGDSDNDGVKNLVEYALVNGGERGVFSGNTITFTKRGAPYGSDLTYDIESSTLLTDGSWSTLAKPPVVENAGSISFTFTPSSPVKNFARLKVVKTP